jgi:Tfp pilus assembly protein FimT
MARPAGIGSILRKKPLFVFSKQRRGFSLLEALVSLFLLGLVTATASRSLQRSTPRYRLLRAVREVHSAMNSARYRAIFKGFRVRVRFNERGYVVEDFDPSEGEWKNRPSVRLEGVTVEANNAPVFHPLGTVSNLASIYIWNGRGRYRITIAISGRIKAVPAEE